MGVYPTRADVSALRQSHFLSHHPDLRDTARAHCQDRAKDRRSTDPEIEVVTLIGGTYRGRTGWRHIIAQAMEEVPGFQLVPEELIDVGDKVVAVTHWGGTGRTSGIAIPDTLGLVYTLRDGLVVRQESFRNKADALEAVGLSE